MQQITIYNGTSHFTTGSTPFGYYDTDLDFQNDIDKFVRWAAYRLGYPIESVELDNFQFYSNYEEAINTYGNEVYKWKVMENYLSLEGQSTGSNLNDSQIRPSLENIIEISKTYGAEIGIGGNLEWNMGTFRTTIGQQMYDMNAWADASASLQPNDKIEIKRVFHTAPPAIVRYFDPYVGTGMGVQSLNEAFGFANYSPAINFMMMPLSFDIAKIQAIELNDQTRKSDYSFSVVNNKLRIFPIPTREYQVFFNYIKKSDRNSASIINSGMGVITDVSKVPYDNPIYSQINSIGRQWIRQYALALCKESLGYVRGKLDRIPIPNGEVTLNQSDLLTDARAEKEKLKEELTLMLDNSSRQKQLERRSTEEDFIVKSAQNQPYRPFYIF